MHKQIFVNLPVRDLKRSMTFFKALGLSFNPAFTNENAACLVIGENLYAMLLTEPFFQTFTDKTLIDAHTHVETLVCLSCESRAEVDDVIAKAVAAGGRTPRPPQDHGFMYGHAFEDLDGHIWELVHMAPEAA
ncbi:VOC family protein [Caballeronia grimmiae]|jgi:predicted lactoylglutathione lyase|uniref:VOC family protein n=1 Tax=Caballeronia grimmiae TaxID=1071679 RepID=UPI0038B6D95A